MPDLPLVSVLCTSYNAEKFVDRALRSILGQAYPNIELVLTDDCSSDRTVEIARSVAANFPSRKVTISVNEQNLGITANCNVGLSQCTGELICLFAGDDLMYPGKISTQVELMIQNPKAGISYHGVDIIRDDGTTIMMLEDRQHKYQGAADIIRYAGIPYTGSIMVRREVIPPHGYDASIKAVSDWIFLIECAVKGEIAMLPGVFGAYRRHAGGVSRKTFALLAETMSTLDIVGKRYPDAGFAVPIAQGRRRYLLGEVARCVEARDTERLTKISSSPDLGADWVVLVAAYGGRFLVASGITQTKVFQSLYYAVSKRTKS